MRLHYYRTLNFGDALCPMLIERLSGVTMGYSHPKVANLIAVGSVLFAGGALFVDKRNLVSAEGVVKLGRKLLDWAHPVLNIWGSGFLVNPKVGDVILIRRTNVCAVRGELTLRVMRRVGMIDGRMVALGDPGILYSDLLTEVPQKEFDIGIVPHFRDKDAGERLGEAYLKVGMRVKVIDVMQVDPLITVKEIASCAIVLSSSLHGLIVSDSLGIPNRHVVFSTLGQSKEEYLFKFNDYYSAYQNRADAPIRFDDVVNDPLSVIHGLSAPDMLEVEAIKRGLIESFPFSIKESGML